MPATGGRQPETIGKPDTPFGEIEEMIDQVDAKFNRFKNFDVKLGNPPMDHHHYDIFNLKAWKNPISSIHQTTMKCELRTFAKNVPRWVFARSYEHRVDLMRAAIIGPPNTPYHGCLFFFDIKFPENYPDKPPKIYYRSYGLDLHPSLRPDGKITILPLSENKWYDRLKQNYLPRITNKKWNPDDESNNLMLVFHAIRDALTTVKLEPHDKSNRKTFALSCQKMVRVLKEPPSDFRDFVQGYFRKMGHTILLNFRENEYYDSLVMIDLFVKMFKVFEGNGAYCKHHLCFLRLIDEKDCGVDVKAKIRELEEVTTVSVKGCTRFRYEVCG
ncbi:Probable ubiquitin-conjugating enzyme E2 23 [Striga hermonthica]|uniref:Probable ubiquitin-conjugating enzyme E2 23 n=1 Tax=Striga hermonthica TaxID=68872 RepID=A0A9N7NLD7_STRHE|nr:Probable ubiquitin-conjugating enzyme E2 23 [Striga hermonthica]